MNLPLSLVDSFTKEPFAGNPAGVVQIEEELPDALMRKIAAEVRASETAFVRPPGPDGLRPLRWFTPEAEVDLCGHATLASGHVLLPGDGTVRFTTRSGVLEVRRIDGALRMDLPSRPPVRVEPMPGLAEALGLQPLEVWQSRDTVVLLESAAAVRDLSPDLAAVAALDTFAVCVTAPGDEVDFVSRFFAPSLGVDEDPVTGSAHATLVPFWAARLGKTTLEARQVSARGGSLRGHLVGDRVLLDGEAVTVFSGTLYV